MTEISRPSDIVVQKDLFGQREVGITHPDTPAFIRLADNGDIEIIGCDGLGIIMRPGNKSMTLIADTIKFLTKEDHGLRWNKLSFNSEATKYTEPAFVLFDDDDVQNLYRGTENYFGS